MNGTFFTALFVVALLIGCSRYGRYRWGRGDAPVSIIFRAFLLAIAGCLAGTVPEARAQLAPGPTIVPSTDQSIEGVGLNERDSASVGFQGGQNRFFAVFPDASTGRITVTLIDTAGNRIGTPTVVSDERGFCPVVEKNVYNPPVVAWVTQSELRMRVLNSDGSPRGPEIVVDRSSDPEFGPGCPALSRYVHDEAHYLLTWSLTGPRSGVFGRILDIANPDPSTPFAGDVFQIASSGTSFVAAAFDYIAGHFLAVYTTGQGVFGQLVTLGGPVGSSFPIGLAPAGTTFDNPAVAFSPEAAEGRFLVAWEERVYIGLGSLDFRFRSRIFGQRVNLAIGATGAATLSLTGDAIDISPPTTGAFESTGPLDVAYSLALGQYLVVWHSAPSTSQVTGRLVNLDGTMPRAPFAISAAPIAGSRGSGPRVAWSETYTPVAVSPAGAFEPNRMEYVALWRGSQGDMRFRFVDPHLDSDGDGLLDDWETAGVDMNNDGQIDATNDFILAALEPNNPPNRLRKDVYLEIDWMDCAAGGCAAGDRHSHRLLDLNGNRIPDVVEQMTRAFARAGVRNPDGSTTINLHVDFGQLGGGNAIADFDNPPALFPPDVKVRNFDRRRHRIFHYTVSTHACCGGGEKPGQFFWAGRGGTEKNLNDAIAIASNTFMHELGHNLGLWHGGDEQFVNNKPNYLSVMNYSFAAGIPVVNAQTPRLDFSRLALPTLDESLLSESAGLGSPPGNLVTIFNCPSGVWSQRAVAGPIDWDCDNRIDTTTVSADLNRNGILTRLTGYDDWNNLFYNFRVIGNFKPASAFTLVNVPPPPEDLPSPEQIHKSLERPVIAIDVKNVLRSGYAEKRFNLAVQIQNVSTALAQNVRIVATIDGRTEKLSLGALSGGQSIERNIAFDLPKKVAKRLTAIVTVYFEDALNQPAAPVMQSVEIPTVGRDQGQGYD